MGPLSRFMAHAVLVGGLLLATAAHGAGVRTLERSGVLPGREIEERIFSYQSSFVNLQRTLERLNSGFDATSPEAIDRSLRLADAGEEALRAARKAVAAVSDFVTANRPYLAGGEQVRYLPFAELKERLEAPYLDRLADCLAAGRRLLGHTGTHFAAISAGQEPQWGRYEEFYRAYLESLERLTAAIDQRAQALRKFAKSHPDLRDQLPP